MLAAWLTDVRHAFRGLRRAPAFFVTSVLTLALAIGAVAGMFNVVYAVLLQPLPYADPNRLVLLAGTAPGSDLPERFNLGWDFYFHFKEQSGLIDGIFGLSQGTSTLRTADRVERVPMAWLSNSFYATLGATPAKGRLPRAEDSDQVMVISHRMWQTWLGGDESVIGKKYFASDGMREVIGIMPPEFRFPDDNTLLWIPGEPRPDQVQPGNLGTPIVARMKPGVTEEQLAAELTQIAKTLPSRYGGPPLYARFAEQYRALVDPLHEVIVGPTVTTSLWVLLAAVALVLLIACANVANLFTVRAEGRRREMAVRRAIGASRLQLARFQMAEALVVAAAAGLLAVLLSTLAVPLFVRAAPDGIPRLASAGLGWLTWTVTFVLVLVVALACGVAPALRASRPSLDRLREGGRGGTGRNRWSRDGLVAFQTALALVLIVGSGLLVRSFQKLHSVNPGYETADIYTFQFAPEQAHLTDGPAWGRLHLDFMNRLRGLPGVTSVGIINNLPLDEGTGGGRWLTDAMSADDGGTLLDQNWTAGDYFSTMGIALLRGRTFTNDEAITPNTNVIISRSAAARLWPDQDALGQRLRRRLGNQIVGFSVVGVVDDVKQDNWRQPGEAVVYFPLTGPTALMWAMGSPAYVVKSPRAASLTQEVRDLVRQVAPEAPVYREVTMAALADRSMVQLSFTMLTLSVIAGLALVLGAVGLYGVLSVVVAERTREIGVRMALGATAGAVRRQIASRGLMVVAAGIAVGLIAAAAATRALDPLLFDVRSKDPGVFVTMPLALVGIGLLASYLPARRASRVDPIEALRRE